MAAVTGNRSIDDNDYEKVIPLAQTGAGITPINLKVDDGDIERKIIALEIAAGLVPHKVIDRKDWTAALLNVQYQMNKRVATVSIASPAVVGLTGHGWVVNQSFRFVTNGALPTGVSVGTTYYVITPGLGPNSFQFATTPGGTAVNTTGSQSGAHSIYPV